MQQETNEQTAPETVEGAGVTASNPEHTPETGGTQTGAANISESADTNLANANLADANLADADIPHGPVNDDAAWQTDVRNGDPRYFQSGKKRGLMKPSAAVSGVDGEKAARAVAGGEAPPTPLFFADVGRPAAQRAAGAGAGNTPKGKTVQQQLAENAERSLIEARAASTAKQAMMMLDMINTMVSGGNYNAPKASREETFAVFKNYALMHNFALPPWLEVSFAAVMYTAPAFMVRPAPGVPSVGEKVKSGIGGWFARKVINRIF